MFQHDYLGDVFIREYRAGGDNPPPILAHLVGTTEFMFEKDKAAYMQVVLELKMKSDTTDVPNNLINGHFSISHCSLRFYRHCVSSCLFGGGVLKRNKHRKSR